MIHSSNKKKYMLLLGVGNYLMGDEGVGVHVARQLTTTELPPGTEVLDGGTGGFHLMGVLEQYPVVVLVDATIDGQEAGTIQLREPKFASDFPRSMSTHDIGLRDVMEALQITGRMPKTYLITVSVEDLQPMSVELSPAVEASVQKVSTQVKTMLWDWWENNEQSFEPASVQDYSFR